MSPLSASFDTPHRRYHDLNQMLSGVTLYPADCKPPRCTSDFFQSPCDLNNGLFCSRWSVENIAQTFLETGCFAHWQRLGFSKLWIEFDPKIAPNRYSMSVWTQISDRSELLMHLIVWIEYIDIERLNTAFPAFYVEHLRLQSPGLPFSRNPMPGQDFASSGILRRIFGILKKWACELGAQVITEIPEYFHTALIFSEYFTFADAEMERLFQNMKRDLFSPDTDLALISAAFEEERIQFEGAKWLWPTEVQVFGLSHELNHLLHLEFPPEHTRRFTCISSHC